MARKLVLEDLFGEGTHGTWHSRAVSWSITSSGGSSWDYYACHVKHLDLWFLTGKGDYYRTNGGITTEQLLDILNNEPNLNMWISDSWTQVYI